MKKCIVDATVKLPVVMDGVVDRKFNKFLANILPEGGPLKLCPPYVYFALKVKQGRKLQPVAGTIVGVLAAHDTSLTNAAPPCRVANLSIPALSTQTTHAPITSPTQRPASSACRRHRS